MRDEIFRLPIQEGGGFRIYISVCCLYKKRGACKMKGCTSKRKESGLRNDRLLIQEGSSPRNHYEDNET